MCWKTSLPSTRLTMRFAKGARLWGAPKWTTAICVRKRRRIAPYHDRFRKGGTLRTTRRLYRPLRYSIAQRMVNLSACFARILAELASRDPVYGDTLSGPFSGRAGNLAYRTSMFISVFSPLYQGTTRVLSDTTFILFQLNNPSQITL